MGHFMAAKRKELMRLNGAYQNTLGGAKVTLMEGRGKVLGPHEVEVGAGVWFGCCPGFCLHPSILKGAKVTLLEGRGKVVDLHEVEVSGSGAAQSSVCTTGCKILGGANATLGGMWQVGGPAQGWWDSIWGIAGFRFVVQGGGCTATPWRWGHGVYGAHIFHRSTLLHCVA